MSRRFSEKLNSLSSTVSLCQNVDVSDLAARIQYGKDRPAVLIGSGGSVVSAEYFRRCRETFSFGCSTVETPMQFVSEVSGLKDCDVWLFTASADHPDVIASVRSAFRRGARSVNMITRSADGRAAQWLRALGGHAFEVPVADRKDGFLATHSLLATVTVLLLAFDKVCDEPFGVDLGERFANAVNAELIDDTREHWRKALSSLEPDDTLIVLADPQLGAVSSLIDTSVWEAAICNVQSTDFRNFAHGRHTWLHRRGDKTLVLALTGANIREVSGSVLALIPDGMRKLDVDFGNSGRFDNAIGLVRGLVLVEAMGDAVGIDPGKPGVATFGRDLYDSEALCLASEPMVSSVQHKYAAVLKQDLPESVMKPLLKHQRDRVQKLADARIGGIVLDYDGTMVKIKDRYTPPEPSIVEQLVRLLQLGLHIAIATGRGGSAGSDLRSVFEETRHQDIIMGYYNGAYLRTLDVDIKTHRPDLDPRIDEVIAWMEDHQHLFAQFIKPKRGVQVSVQRKALVSPDQFLATISECPPVIADQVRLDCSEHSFDLVVSYASKLNVVDAIHDKIASGSSVLCLGDSGSINGNDHDLVSHLCGISVGDVCSNPEGSWSLFGHRKSGPDALLAILRSLVPSTEGEVRFDMTALDLDKSHQISS